MRGPLSPAEQAVLSTALERGWIDVGTLAQLQASAPPGGLLPALRPHLSPQALAELRAVHASAGAVGAGALGARAPAPAQLGPLGPGAQVGPYRIERELARGGMGVVFVARDAQGRAVALKMLQRELAGPELAARFAAEAEVTARLNHPNVVGVHASGEHAGQAWYAMQLVEGESLGERLAREGPLEPLEAARICKAIAEGLAHVHERGVLHRDLKPDNVLLAAPDGRPVITDFGVARREYAEDRMTRTGQLVGTPAFMPPEQASGEVSRIGPQSDIYSLGATLYAALTGEPPFGRQQGHVQVIACVLTKDPDPPSRRRPGLSRDLDAVVLTCMAKDPTQRYAEAAALADDLDRYLAGREVQARLPSLAERVMRRARRNRPAAAALALVLLLGSPALAYGLWLGVRQELENRAAKSKALDDVATQRAETRTRQELVEAEARAAQLLSREEQGLGQLGERLSGSQERWGELDDQQRDLEHGEQELVVPAHVRTPKEIEAYKWEQRRRLERPLLNERARIQREVEGLLKQVQRHAATLRELDLAGLSAQLRQRRDEAQTRARALERAIWGLRLRSGIGIVWLRIQLGQWDPDQPPLDEVGRRRRALVELDRQERLLEEWAQLTPQERELQRWLAELAHARAATYEGLHRHDPAHPPAMAEAALQQGRLALQRYAAWVEGLSEPPVEAWVRLAQIACEFGDTRIRLQVRTQNKDADTASAEALERALPALEQRWRAARRAGQGAAQGSLAAKAAADAEGVFFRAQQRLLRNLFNVGRYTDCKAAADRLIDLAEVSPDGHRPPGIKAAIEFAGLSLVRLEQPANAQQYFARWRSIRELAGAPESRPYVLEADALQQMKSWQRAHALLQQAVPLYAQEVRGKERLGPEERRTGLLLTQALLRQDRAAGTPFEESRRRMLGFLPRELRSDPQLHALFEHFSQPAQPGE